MSKKHMSREQVIRAEANAISGATTDDQGAVSWRDDPGETYSDWTIQVLSNGETHATYHVHRNILGRGPRRSEYFNKMFQRTFKENDSSRLDLNPMAARLFPKLLDFAYHSTRDLEIDTESAAAFLALGKYLMMDQIVFIAERFIRKDIVQDNMGVYWEQSELFPEESLHDIMVDFLMKHRLKVLPSNLVAKTASPVWEKVAEKVAGEKDSNRKETLSKRLTKLFAEYRYMKAQSEPLDATSFRSILSKESAPTIHGDVALMLAEEHERLPPDENETSGPCLLGRCSLALTQADWFQHCLSTADEGLSERLRKLPGSFVFDVCQQSLEQSSKLDPRTERMRREFKTKLEGFVYEKVWEEKWKMEVKKRDELNVALKQCQKASPEVLSLRENMASAQYQSTEEYYDMQTEVFDEVLASKFLEKDGVNVSEDTSEPSPPAAKKAKTDKPATTKAMVRGKRQSDLYPVGRKVFHRHTGDGFGGREYPAIIIAPEGNIDWECRRITYEGYGSRYDMNVHINDLLDYTKKREDVYKNETVPLLKENDDWVEEEKQRALGHIDGATGEDAVCDYVKNKVYYLKDTTDGIEYPVKIIRFCTKLTHKCEIKFNHYGKKVVELRCLLPATPQREQKYNAHREFSHQQKKLETTTKNKASQEGWRQKNTCSKRKRNIVEDRDGDKPMEELEANGSGLVSEEEIGDELMKALNAPNPKSGSWSLNQELLFHYGLKKYGKGSLGEIAAITPNRDAIQCKSHCQKVMIRKSAGDPIFQILEDHKKLLKLLLQKWLVSDREDEYESVEEEDSSETEDGKMQYEPEEEKVVEYEADEGGNVDEMEEKGDAVGAAELTGGQN